MQINDVITFSGKQNSDINPRLLQPGDFLRVVNGHAGNSSTGNRAVVESVNGTQQISFTFGGLADGTNKVVGRCEDRNTNRIFYAVWNSNSNHRWFEFNADTLVLQQIAAGPALGFTEFGYLNNPSLIDDMLYWVDGGSPKKINVERARTLGKNQVLRICLGGSLSGFKGSLEIEFTGSKTVPPPFSFPYNKVIDTTGWNPASYFELMDLLTAALNGDLFLIDTCSLTFVSMGDYVEMRDSQPLQSAGYWSLSMSFTPSETDIPIYIRPYWVYENTYASPLTAADLSRIKYPPLSPPKAEYDIIPGKIGINRIYSQCFQFACRYVYDDNEITTLGPATAITVDNELTGRETADRRNNVIYIDIDEANLQSGNRHNLRAVDIVFRQGNELNWQLFRRLNTGELNTKLEFFNDGYYQALSAIESGLPFYTVPLKSKTQEFAVNRGFLTADEEGENPISTRITATAQRVDPGAQTSKELFTIKGNIVVNNLGGTAVQKTVNPDGKHYMGWFQVPLGGLVVYLAGTNFSVVSTFIESGTDLIYEWEIKNVPPGRYIARVASHMLRSDESLGPVFTYSQERIDYQRTSTNVIAVNGGTSYAAEIAIHVQDADIDLTNAGGTFLVIAPEQANLLSYASGYLKDTFTAVPSVANVKTAEQVERALIDWNQDGIAYPQSFYAGDLQVSRADHNGYYFFYRVAASPVVMTSTEARLATTSGLLVSSFANEKYFTAGNPFPGGSLVDGGLIVATDDPSGPFTGSLDAETELFFFQRTLIVSRALNTKTTIATRVVGLVVDGNGNPVRNYLLTVQQTTRFVVTDSTGRFSILIYSTSANGNDRSVTLFGAYLGNREMVSPASSATSSIFEIGTTYTFDNPLSLSPGPRTLLSLDQVGVNMPKSGGSYQYAVVYVDEGGRFPGAFTNPEALVNVPTVFQPQKFSDFYYIEIRIKHRAPAWARKMLLVRTRELYYQNYIQLPVFEDDVSFAKRTEEGAFEEQAVEDQDTVAFCVELTAVRRANASGQQAAISYQRSPGDRVRLVDGSGVLFDREVVGQDGFNVYIDRQIGDVIPSNSVLEFYQPRNLADENLYFQIGQAFDVLENGFHAGNVQNQSGIQDCIIHTNIGDSFLRYRFINELGYYAQDPNVYDDVLSRFQSVTRPTVISKTDDISNPGLRKTNRGYVIRASNALVQDTKINGLSAFEPGLQESLPINEGEINTMFWDGQSLITQTQTMTRRLLVGEAFVKSADGSDEVMQLRNQLFGGHRPVGQAGTRHPEGSCRYRGALLFWDQVAGALQLYMGNQVVNLSQQFEFLTTSNELQAVMRSAARSKLSSCYDPARAEFVMAFEARNSGGTVVLNRVFKIDAARGVVGEYEFQPEELAAMQSMIYSFTAGGMHAHSDAINRMRFYGVQRKLRLESVINEQPDQRKVLDAIKVMATRAPDLPVISTDEGQLSELLATDFVQVEGNQFFASFLYDKNTPNAESAAHALVNGEEMRSTHFKVVMEFGGTGLIIFTAAQSATTLSR